MSSGLVDGYNYGASSRNPFNYVKVEQINRDVATPWLTLDEITQQINLYDDESQDAYLQSLELATRFAVEDYLGLSIFPTTYRCYYGAQGFVATPASLDLPEVTQNGVSTPGVTVDSVGFWNDSSPSVFVPITGYSYDPSGNKIILGALPSNINLQMTAPIVAVYTTAASPIAYYPVVKQAGLLLLTHFYNNRSNSTEANLKTIPMGFDVLLRSYKSLVM